MQYIIYMDESNDEGPYFGNFYGGALVRSTHYQTIVELLHQKKKELNMDKEIKWQKVTLNYLDKYKELMDLLFSLIEQDLIKIRIMFTQNYHQPQNLTKEQRDNEFLLLYYQFLKHAFGLKYSNQTLKNVSLRLYFDELPVSPANKDKFLDFVENLEKSPDFREAKIKIFREDITDVKSDQHVILQYMDIVLGSMYFRLNDFHKAIPEGQRKRGNRTIAKEALYKHINQHIRRIYPGFNIGKSTGTTKYEDRWNHPYRHWLFVPSDYKIAPQYTKK